MRCSFCLLMTAAILLFGCSSTQNTAVVPNRFNSAKPSARKPDKLIITPVETPKGTVVRVNTASRYAIVSFPLGAMPGNGQVVGVFRNGLKVGVLRITGPQQGEDTAADITDGEAVEGDDVRVN